MLTFKIVQNNQVHRFDLPPEVIEKDTFLDTILITQFPIQRDDDGAYYLDQPVEYFREFVSFLKGGEFRWHQEIADYFDMMSSKLSSIKISSIDR